MSGVMSEAGFNNTPESPWAQDALEHTELYHLASLQEPGFGPLIDRELAPARPRVKDLPALCFDPADAWGQNDHSPVFCVITHTSAKGK